MESVYNEASHAAGPTAGEDTVTDKDQTEEDYYFKDNEAYIKGHDGEKDRKFANFEPIIEKIEQLMDAGEYRGQRYLLTIRRPGKETQFYLPADQFKSGMFMQAIRREIGPEAWLEGSEQRLLLLVQKNIIETVPREQISLSTGFDQNFNEFVLPGIRITSEGVQYNRQAVVLLPERFVGKIANFQEITDDETKLLLHHVLFEFVPIKSRNVMLPLIGHLGISVLASWIVDFLGKQKYTLHLKGLSGGGKTFIASLVASFFGNSGDRLMSWSSTANAIESEGYHSRDLIYIVDDYKRSVTSPKELTRVLQNYADNHGRSRLNSSSSRTNSPHIRGFLLSTGEDFVKNVESVTGRTIVLDVEPEHNREAGDACRSMQHLYNGLLPRFVYWLISEENWQENLKNFIESKIEEFIPLVNGISNGLRIVTNWAINAAGFELLCRFAVHVEAIDNNLNTQLLNEYAEVVQDHLRSQVATLKAENPVSIFFDMLEQLIFTETVVIEGLPGVSSKKTATTIGKVSGKEVQFYHSIAMPHLINLARQLNQPLPFTKENLRSALDQKGLLIRQNGRLSVQVRHQEDRAGRVQAWKFDLTEFKKLCPDPKAKDAEKK